MAVRPDPDGSILLTTDAVADLLVAVAQHAGGRLISWQLDHVDSAPNHSTTATYYAQVEWPQGERTELIGISARAGTRVKTDSNAETFTDGDREVVVWFYPQDPDLPGLPRAAHPVRFAELINARNLIGRQITPDEVQVRMIGYRPRRRAVLRAAVGNQVFYTKVLRPKVFTDVLGKHRLLINAGIPAPQVLASTDDQLIVLAKLPGMSLAKAMFHPTAPCSADQLIGILDGMPAAVAELERRRPWSDSIAHYADIVSRAFPAEASRLKWLTREITAGLRDIPLGMEPTHGDFHEGQLHVNNGRIVGMLDIDTIGPGRRADDLACLVAHLSTVQGMNSEQANRIQTLLRDWVPVFDERVDPVELRLRAAAVVVSLATGPHRSQDPNWRAQTTQIIGCAMALVRQVA